ncbi:MAG TPA: DUF1990 family protein [Capillimicrobium sp.]|nr:DUF1990 family protein [Capillimicrobium sp.]
MPRKPSMAHRVGTALTWPAGVAVTSWAYLWRTLPMHRRELEGTLERDGPPPLPDGVDLAEVQRPEDGAGPLFHRRYRVAIRESRLGAADLVARIREDPNRVAPTSLARFHKVKGDEDAPLALGDEYVVRMPGPWDGPVRVVEADAGGFRFATLDGHLEAGQIAWRARDDGGRVVFEVESWARPGDRLSSLLHHRLRMAKEVQLHMWTSVCQQVAELSGGRIDGGIDIETRVAPVPA